MLENDFLGLEFESPQACIDVCWQRCSGFDIEEKRSGYSTVD
jgi:hypothetical protein